MANTTGQVMPDGSVQYYEDAMGRAMISSEYDPTSSYAVGDYCMYNDVRYCCNTAIASGGETWNSAHWDVAKVDDDISEIKQSLSQKANKNWTLWDNTSASSVNVTIPSDVTELLIVVSFNDGSNNWYAHEFVIPVALLTNTYVNHVGGWYYSNTDYGSMLVKLNSTNVNFVSATKNGASKTPYTNYYYR